MKPSEIIKKYGWCQGNYYQDKQGNQFPYSAVITMPQDELDQHLGACCANGAIFLAEESVRKLHNHIVEKTEYSGATAWNDAPGRTKEEVIELLESINL